MLDTVEIRRISKNTDTEVIDIVRKQIEWRDILSVEEGGSEVQRELEEDNLIYLTLPYIELVVVAEYGQFKRKWLAWREFAKKEDQKLTNILN